MSKNYNSHNPELKNSKRVATALAASGLALIAAFSSAPEAQADPVNISSASSSQEMQAQGYSEIQGLFENITNDPNSVITVRTLKSGDRQVISKMGDITIIKVSNADSVSYAATKTMANGEQLYLNESVSVDRESNIISDVLTGGRIGKNGIESGYVSVDGEISPNDGRKLAAIREQFSN